jgi:hypothetical protein
VDQFVELSERLKAEATAQQQANVLKLLEDYLPKLGDIHSQLRMSQLTLNICEVLLLVIAVLQLVTLWRLW